MSDKSFWNVDKEKRQIFFLYHFLNLGKGELEKQIDEQLKNDSSNQRGNKSEIEQHRTRKYPELEFNQEIMRKAVDKATAEIGTCINNRDLKRLAFPYCGYINSIDLECYFNTDTDDVDKQAKKILLEIYEKAVIPYESFSWIDIKDTRLISYIWSRLRISFEDENYRSYLNYSHNLLLDDDITSASSRHIRPVYEKLGLEINASQNEIRFQNIISFFDLWAAPLDKKKETLQIIGNNWEVVRNDYKMTEWINTNESYVIHIWDYVISNFANNKTPKWSYISFIDKKKDLEQTKLALQTFYDLLSSKINKKALLTAIKANVRDKRYYEKHADTTKLLNTRVSIEAADALNKLAKMKGESKKVILETLIIDGLKSQLHLI